MRRLAYLLCVLGACATDEEPRDPPVIRSITPGLGDVGGGDLVTIHGDHLNEATITIGDVPCTQVAGGSSAASCFTGDVGVAEGPCDVVLTTAAGIAVLPQAFTYCVTDMAARPPWCSAPRSENARRAPRPAALPSDGHRC
jgi:IPT/TIG domain